MSVAELLPALNLFTLIAFLAIAAGLAFFFFRKKENRHPMDNPRGRATEDAHRRELEQRRREDERSSL